MTKGTMLKALAAASVALAGVAFAHPHEGHGDGEKKVERVVVLTRSGDHKGAEKHVREFRMLRGPGGEFQCPGGETAKVDETTGGDRTKILICDDGKASSADRVKRLEETLGRIRSDDHFSAEHKAKVEAALEDALARLRASN